MFNKGIVCGLSIAISLITSPCLGVLRRNQLILPY